MDTYDDWADIIQELDARATMPPDAEAFIIHLVEDKPLHLSERQVAWLRDLKARYIGD